MLKCGIYIKNIMYTFVFGINEITDYYLALFVRG